MGANIIFGTFPGWDLSSPPLAAAPDFNGFEQLKASVHCRYLYNCEHDVRYFISRKEGRTGEQGELEGLHK